MRNLTKSNVQTQLYLVMVIEIVHVHHTNQQFSLYKLVVLNNRAKSKMTVRLFKILTFKFNYWKILGLEAGHSTCWVA